MGLTTPAGRELAGAAAPRKGSAMQHLSTATTPAATETGLSPDVRRLVASSIAPNTRKAYEAALIAWDIWLGGREAGDELLANYLSERHAAGVSPATVAQVVQSIRFREKLHGAAVSVVGPIADRALAGIRREGRGRGRGQVAAIRWADVQAICRLTGTEASEAPVAAARDCALMRVMSDGLLRISEAVAVDCEHISTEADGTGRLLIPSAKTDQTGQGAVVFLSKTTMDAVDAYRQLVGIESGPLFRRMRRGDHITEDRMSAHGPGSPYRPAPRLLVLRGHPATVFGLERLRI